MRLPNGVERVGADDRVQRHAGLARAGADLAHELALERLLVELALAGHHGARGAHARVEVRARRAPTARRARARRRAPPTGRRRARRRSRSSARRAGRAGSRAASSSSRSLEARDHRRVGALLRAEHLRGVLERRADVAQHDELRAAEPAALLDRLQRAGAAVGRRRAADRHEDRPARPPPRRRRSARRCRRSRRPTRRAPSSATSPRPLAAAISTIAVPPSSTRPKPAGSLAPERVVRRRRRRPRRRARGSSASSVPSPPSATGHRSGGIRPARSSPRPIAPATSDARKVPLNESGATSTGRSGTAIGGILADCRRLRDTSFGGSVHVLRTWPPSPHPPLRFPASDEDASRRCRPRSACSRPSGASSSSPAWRRAPTASTSCCGRSTASRAAC